MTYLTREHYEDREVLAFEMPDLLGEYLMDCCLRGVPAHSEINGGRPHVVSVVYMAADRMDVTVMKPFAPYKAHARALAWDADRPRLPLTTTAPPV